MLRTLAVASGDDVAFFLLLRREEAADAVGGTPFLWQWKEGRRFFLAREVHFCTYTYVFADTISYKTSLSSTTLLPGLLSGFARCGRKNRCAAAAVTTAWAKSTQKEGALHGAWTSHT